MLQLDQIHIRDPFVYTDSRTKKYYMYGTMGITAWGGKAIGFDGYRSDDLINWEGPFPAFRSSEDFWADHHFWAPEVHFYKGSYYMFASFKAEGLCRGTQILRSTDPLGPFIPMGAEPITPRAWECLDGTLYVDKEDTAWIVFCHEWTQIQNGAICAMPLSDDLSEAIGEPIALFQAADAQWPVEAEGAGNYVTDGPFLYAAPDGKLVMIWSSHGEDGYAIGVAVSETGDIRGPWRQEQEPLFAKNGGHGMLFRTLDGQLLLAMHVPNTHPDERPAFFEINYKDGQFVLLS